MNEGMVMNQAEVDWVFKLLDTLPFVDLATIDADQFPAVRAVMNLRSAAMSGGYGDLFANNYDLYFCVHLHSPKVLELQANSKCAVYGYQNDTMEALLLSGEAELVTDPQLKQLLWQDDWTMYYPGGVQDPEYSILKFVPQKYKYYDEAQQKHEGSLH